MFLEIEARGSEFSCGGGEGVGVVLLRRRFGWSSSGGSGGQGLVCCLVLFRWLPWGCGEFTCSVVLNGSDGGTRSCLGNSAVETVYSLSKCTRYISLILVVCERITFAMTTKGTAVV